MKPHLIPANRTDRRPTADPRDRETTRILSEVSKGGAAFERIVFTRNRRIMASVTERGRTLRLHQTFQQAPEEVLWALGEALSNRRPDRRHQSRAVVRSFLNKQSRGAPPQPVARRPARPTAADLPHLERLRRAFDAVNAEYFDCALPSVPIRLSGRMRRRNGHFIPDPLEIAISRALCVGAPFGEAERTLRHEMIHLWQWRTGRKPGHGQDFRDWARKLEITPRSTRTVSWLAA